MDIVVSTRNKDKFKEISEILQDSQIKVLSLEIFSNPPKVVENGKTFSENACKKALKISRITKQLTVADDSGLEVSALDNAPGIYSARFSGRGATYESNNKKLLRLLKNLPKSKRKARFVCCVAVADEQGIIGIVEGECRGTIAYEENGKKGFGYDPIFICNEYKKTFAQLSPAIKNKISHRAKAFAKAKKVILKYIEKKG